MQGRLVLGQRAALINAMNPALKEDIINTVNFKDPQRAKV